MTPEELEIEVKQLWEENKGLHGIIESQKQTHDALVKKLEVARDVADKAIDDDTLSGDNDFDSWFFALQKILAIIDGKQG
jgi:hypothetical protein